MFVIGPRSKAVVAKNEMDAIRIATLAREVIGKPCQIVNLGGVIKVKCGDMFVCRD
jgi:hypothetical protein